MSENNLNAKRETWGSRVGYILSSLGMAIGVGAIWRFPMMTAQNGGGAFVLAFVIIAVIIVIPSGWAETALGRKYKKGLTGTFTAVAGKKGRRLSHLTSFIGVGLLAYYPVILAVVVQYLYYTAKGAPYLEDVTGFYEKVNDSRVSLYIILVAIIVLTALISMKGIKAGIEKCCKFMLPIMFALIIIVAICMFTVDGISEGITYYLKPDFSMLKDPELWFAAAGMALFAIGVGPGFLPIYGSYLDDKADLATDYIITTFANIAVCLICGFAIIPGTVVFGLDATAGKGVLFQSLPLVFSNMPGGMLWFVLFMIVLLFAGISTTVAQMEIPVANFIDAFNMPRKKAIIIVAIAACILAIPCVWSDEFFTFFDNMVGNVLYCVMAAIVSFYLAWIVGAKKIREDWYNPTSKIKWGSWVDILYKFIAVPAFAYFAIVAVISLF